MDFNRDANQRPAQTNRPNGEAAPHAAGARPPKPFKFAKFGSFVLLVLITLLVAALLIVISTSNKGGNEAKLVDKSNLQAVFLTNGQVYFGNVNEINNDYIKLSDIYYLTTQTAQPSTTTSTTTTSSSSSVSLVKLGCELHAPQDNMVIERSQVSFWENLKSSGQVASAVKDYKTKNPKNTCSTSSSSSTDTTGTTSSTSTNQ